MGRVLVIDDNVHVLKALCRTLKLDGHEVTAVENGKEAIILLRTGMKFDVILCDQSMPGLTGEEVYVILKDLDTEMATRFLLMTGAITEIRIDVPCIRKPFDPDFLKRVGALAGLPWPKKK